MKWEKVNERKKGKKEGKIERKERKKEKNVKFSLKDKQVMRKHLELIILFSPGAGVFLPSGIHEPVIHLFFLFSRAGAVAWLLKCVFLGGVAPTPLGGWA